MRSFGYALDGLRFIAATQQNWRVHVVLAVGAVLAAAGLGLTPTEWALLVLTIGLVLALEAVNTAVESAVDAMPGSSSDEKRRAKDCAAAGVLLGALSAVGVAAVLFGPRLLALLRA